jgi:hypothetical protein
MSNEIKWLPPLYDVHTVDVSDHPLRWQEGYANLRCKTRSGVPSKWCWDATVHGYANTEEEAKAAAARAVLALPPKVLALLREARESVVALADEYESLMLATETEETQRELARQIDALLKQYEETLP